MSRRLAISLLVVMAGGVLPIPVHADSLPDSAGSVDRISTSSADQQGKSHTGRPHWSPDGKKIAFEALAHSGLVTGKTPYTEVFIKDLSSGALKRVAVTKKGKKANGPSEDPVWSPDGRKVAFVSWATNVTRTKVPGVDEVLVKNLRSGVVQVISSSRRGVSANEQSGAPVWSPDGKKIAFWSRASNLGPGKAGGLFVKTLGTGEVTRVFNDKTGLQRGHRWGVSRPRWAPDSKSLAFNTDSSRVIPGDTNTLDDVFVVNVANGNAERVSTGTNGEEANGYSYVEAWSPTGREISFYSTATNLIGGEIISNPHGAIFVKDLVSGAVRRIAEGRESRWSPDGTRMLFVSGAAGLVAGDSNREDDLFVVDLATGSVQRVSTSSEGRQGNGSIETAWLDPAAWSPDGTRIAFVSNASNLVPGDTNRRADIFVKTLR